MFPLVFPPNPKLADINKCISSRTLIYNLYFASYMLLLFPFPLPSLTLEFLLLFRGAV